MTATAQVLPFRPRRRRRDDIRAHLAAWERDRHGRAEWASSARETLERAGPVFGAFAAYLGLRIDLLAAADCRELSRASPAGQAVPIDSVRALLSAELGRTGAQTVAVDPVPIAVGVVTQTHRSFLPDGRIVHVHIHSGSFLEASEDLECLALVEPVFTGRIAGPALDSAIADFRALLQEEADLLARAALLEDGAREIRRGAPVILPRSVPGLCSARMLVTDFEDDEPELLMRDTDSPSPESSSSAALKAWLHQALFGSVCPMYAAGDRITMCGGSLPASSVTRLAAGTQRQLLTYLFAVAGDSPDRAWPALQPQLSAAADAAPAEHVQREFRRLVPFRDDRSTNSGSPLADEVFLQWRVASRHGWLPAPQTARFYRGLFGVMCAAPQAAADDGDALAEAVAWLRVTSDVRELGTWMGDAEVVALLERQMALLIELPQKLDRLLSVAADGSVRVQLVADSSAAVQRHRATVVAALLLAAAAIVLAGALPAVRQFWASEPWRAAAVAATGALLVWAVGRWR